MWKNVALFSIDGFDNLFCGWEIARSRWLRKLSFFCVWTLRAFLVWCDLGDIHTQSVNTHNIYTEPKLLKSISGHDKCWTRPAQACLSQMLRNYLADKKSSVELPDNSSHRGNMRVFRIGILRRIVYSQKDSRIHRKMFQKTKRHNQTSYPFINSWRQSSLDCVTFLDRTSEWIRCNGFVTSRKLTSLTKKST